MPSLYGIPIPTGAKQIEVKPVLGSGPTRALFRGAVEENGRYVTEDDIADQAGRDQGFWDYIKVQASAGRLKQPESGIWSFRLAVKFFDQFGAVASIDTEGKTTRTTDEPWEFFPSVRVAAQAAAPDPMATALAFLRDMHGAFAAEHKAALQESRSIVSTAVAAAQEIVKTASTEAQKLLAAGAEPLRHTVDRVVEQARHETARADDATKDVVTLVREGESGGSLLDGLGKLVTVAPVAIPLVKKILN